MGKRHIHRTYLFTCFLVLIALPIITATCAHNNQISDPGTFLFLKTEQKGDLDTEGKTYILRTRYVRINFDLLTSAEKPDSPEQKNRKILGLNLFPDVFYTAIVDSVQSNPLGGNSLIGHIEGFEHSQVILSVNEGNVAGNIVLPDAIYQVRYAGNGVHAIHQIDQSAFPDEAEPTPVDPEYEESAFPDVDPFSPDVKNVVEGNTAFALNIYHKISDTKENIFFSPYSISTALAMTYAGARENTEKQMAEVLHFSLDQNRLHPSFSAIQSHYHRMEKRDTFHLNIANALWIHMGYQLLSEFKELNRKYYRANLFSLDFKKEPDKSRLQINSWVEEKTEKKIQNLLPEGVITDRTRLILTNTVYFKAEWQNKFEKENTEDLDFLMTSEQKVKTPMMKQKGYFAYKEDEALQVLKMSYRGTNMSMIVLLPKTIDGLTQLESQLSSKTLKEWTSILQSKKVNVLFPKFKTTEDYDLKDILKSLGMTDAFSQKADFSGMEPKRELYISDILHKAFIDVDEEGTEAAAATAVLMPAGAAPQAEEPPEFRADHPFLYIIQDNETGSILFMGRLMDPR